MAPMTGIAARSGPLARGQTARCPPTARHARCSQPTAALDDRSIRYVHCSAMTILATPHPPAHPRAPASASSRPRASPAWASSELLQASEVPKGSFYHYFKSKEALRPGACSRTTSTDYLAAAGFAVLQTRAEPNGTGASCWATSSSGAATQSDASCGEQKCLVVKLGAEVADLSEAMRLTLRDGTERVIARLARLHRGALFEDGSLSAAGPCLCLIRCPWRARSIQLWLGASLLAKLHRNGAARARVDGEPALAGGLSRQRAPPAPPPPPPPRVTRAEVAHEPARRAH
jgi:TetR/AcrR family transcriptional repressor of nem operon